MIVLEPDIHRSGTIEFSLITVGNEIVDSLFDFSPQNFTSRFRLSEETFNNYRDSISVLLY